MIYQNIKTGGLYRWLAAGVDCTNSRDGTPVAIYCPLDNENTVFVRELGEFYLRFRPVGERKGG